MPPSVPLPQLLWLVGTQYQLTPYNSSSNNSSTDCNKLGNSWAYHPLSTWCSRVPLSLSSHQLKPPLSYSTQVRFSAPLKAVVQSLSCASSAFSACMHWHTLKSTTMCDRRDKRRGVSRETRVLSLACVYMNACWSSCILFACVLVHTSVCVSLSIYPLGACVCVFARTMCVCMLVCVQLLTYAHVRGAASCFIIPLYRAH